MSDTLGSKCIRRPVARYKSIKNKGTHFKNHKWVEYYTNSQDIGKYRATHECSRCHKVKARILK